MTHRPTKLLLLALVIIFGCATIQAQPPRPYHRPPQGPGLRSLAYQLREDTYNLLTTARDLRPADNPRVQEAIGRFARLNNRASAFYDQVATREISPARVDAAYADLREAYDQASPFLQRERGPERLVLARGRCATRWPP